MHRNLGTKADDRNCWSAYHRWIKKQKLRLERRAAKRNPECTPGYGKYRGWEL